MSVNLVIEKELDTAANKTVGIFGSAFDPPHFGHVAVVAQSLTHLQIDELWLSCSWDRWDKTCVSPYAVRHSYCQAFADELFVRGFSVRCLSRELMEKERDGTYEFLCFFKSKGISPVLILGTDSYAGIEQWRNVTDNVLNGSKLCDEFQVAIANRQNETNLKCPHHKSLPLLSGEQALSWTGLTVAEVQSLSSTQVRQGIQNQSHQIFCYDPIMVLARSGI